MPLQKLVFQPGVDKERTPYSNETMWTDSDKVRFRAGRPETILGWQEWFSATIVGTIRSIHVWSILDGNVYYALGTFSKIYVGTGGSLIDVTPIRATTALGTDPLTSTAGSAVITVTDTSHGAADGDYVTFSGATTFDGIPDTELNAEHQITLIDGNTYTITVTTTGSAGVSGGGASVIAEYQINVGEEDGFYAAGFGIGAWGITSYGDARPSSLGTLNPRTWALTNWGEDLVFNPSHGSVFVWDASSPTSRGTRIDNAPRKVTYTLVTDDRHMMCFGCNTPASDATAEDSLQIRW